MKALSTAQGSVSRSRFFPSTPDLIQDTDILERVGLPQLSEAPPVKARLTEYNNLGQRGSLPLERSGSLRDSSPNSPPSPASSDSSQGLHAKFSRPAATQEAESGPSPTSHPPRLHPMLPLDLHRINPSAASGGHFATDRPYAADGSISNRPGARSHRSPRRTTPRSQLLWRVAGRPPDHEVDQPYLSFVARPHAPGLRRVFAPPPRAPPPRMDRLRPPSDLASNPALSRPASGRRPGSDLAGGGGGGGSLWGDEELGEDLRLGTPKEISRVRTNPPPPDPSPPLPPLPHSAPVDLCPRVGSWHRCGRRRGAWTAAPCDGLPRAAPVGHPCPTDIPPPPSPGRRSPPVPSSPLSLLPAFPILPTPALTRVYGRRLP